MYLVSISRILYLGIHRDDMHLSGLRITAELERHSLVQVLKRSLAPT